MPVYLPDVEANRKKLFFDAVDSVLCQLSDVPIELIIIDDCSVVPVANLASEFLALKDLRVRIIRNSSNLKLVTSLNVGLRSARYNLIARLDADDLWKPGKIAAQLKEYGRNPYLTLSATSMYLDYLNAPELNRDEIRAGDSSAAHLLFHKLGCPFPHGSILARKDIFMLLGGYPTQILFAHCEDYALWSEWIRFFQTSILADVYLVYRVSADGVSALFCKSQQVGSQIVSRKYFDLELDPAIYNSIILELAELLGVEDQVEWGCVLYCTWKHFNTVVVNDHLIASFRKIFPDRLVVPYSSHLETEARSKAFLCIGKKFNNLCLEDLILKIMESV